MDLINKEKETKEQVESTRGHIYYMPEADIYEDKESFKIIFDLPGIEKEDISLKVEKDILSITADSNSKPLESYECIREEMDFNGFQRSFKLNGIVDTNNIVADFNLGTLTLSLPKKEELKSKEIQIKVS